MRYIIAAYRVRNNTLRLYESLNNIGIRCAIDNTPQAAAVGCGISVRFNERDFDRVRAKVANIREGFAGYFLVDGNSITRL